MIDLAEFEKAIRVVHPTSIAALLAMLKAAFDAGRGCVLEWDQLELCLRRGADEPD